MDAFRYSFERNRKKPHGSRNIPLPRTGKASKTAIATPSSRKYGLCIRKKAREQTIPFNRRMIPSVFR